MATLREEDVLNRRVIRIAHSPPTEPEFVVQGIGPAQFRSHYVLLDNGIVIHLFIAELTSSSEDKMVIDGETEGIPAEELVGRTVTDVWNDDTSSCILVLDREIYMKDANDGFYGNPLRAGYVQQDYDELERSQFTDYWTGEPVRP